MHDDHVRIHNEVKHDGYRFIISSDEERIVCRSLVGSWCPWIITVAPHTEDTFGLFFFSSAGNDPRSDDWNLVNDSAYSWLFTPDEARELATNLLIYANGMEKRLNEDSAES